MEQMNLKAEASSLTYAFKPFNNLNSVNNLKETSKKRKRSVNNLKEVSKKRKKICQRRKTERLRTLRGNKTTNKQVAKLFRKPNKG